MPEREEKESRSGRERAHFLLASASATLASASQVQAPCLRASRDLPLWPVFRHLPRALIPLTIGTARLAGPGQHQEERSLPGPRDPGHP